MLLRTPRHLDPAKASADDWPLHTTASRLVVWQMGFFQVCWLTLPLLFIKLRRQLLSPPTLRLKASVASGDAFRLPSARVLPRLESSLGAVCGQCCQCKHYFISTLVLPKENQWDSFLRLLFSEGFVCTLINFWRFQLRNATLTSQQGSWFVSLVFLNKVLGILPQQFFTAKPSLSACSLIAYQNTEIWPRFARGGSKVHNLAILSLWLPSNFYSRITV